jgi:hypothetical protein
MLWARNSAHWEDNMNIKLKHELAFYALMALALLFGNSAHASDTLEMIGGSAHQRWTGNLESLRWGMHTIEFEAYSVEHWTDDSGGFGSGFDALWDFWTIDVDAEYNHMHYHIPMTCHVEAVFTLGQYAVTATCRGP